MARDTWIAYEDHGARRCIELDAVERERRSSGEDDVDLLVPECFLRVLLHDRVADARCDVGIDPERADIEGATDGLPEERSADDPDRFDPLESHALPSIGHARTLAGRLEQLRGSRGPDGKRDVDRELLAVPQDRDRHLVTRASCVDGALEGFSRVDP